MDSSDSESESDGSSEESMAGDEWPPNPPVYGYPDGGGGERRPPFVLIDPEAYFADRLNATTAVCEMSGPKLRGRLQVTFCAAAPPLVSYFCVHATAMDYTEFAVEPRIVATESDGGLVLLCVVAGDHAMDATLARNRRYFVYDARAPVLHHIPSPGDRHPINPPSLAVMRTGDGNHFAVAAQAHIFWGGESPQLCIYHSHTETWTNKPVVMGDSCPEQHFTSKTLTMGGSKGTVAWVDLWRGIIFCDVLAERPKPTFLKLPPPIRPRPDNAGYGGARSARDIAIFGNSIRYLEMLCQPNRSSHEWQVVTWCMKKTLRPSAKDWELVCKLDSTDINVDAGAATAAHPTLSTLHVGLPTLSLQDNDIVYFLGKIDYRKSKHTAWVFAVDMKTKTLKQVAEFSAERTFGLAKGYDASRISAYLQPTPGTKQISKRPGVPLLKSPCKKHNGDDDAMVIDMA